ncbi:hypothetical protein QP157_08470 [Sphingomonas sp. LR61]|uniref:hypothetical protein n=1 Tax=Sphingomonas sp. LR61 TaxID=3050234 RepID=UPI002FE40E88
MPPATGTCLSIVSRTPPRCPAASATSRAARIARFDSSTGTFEVSIGPVKVTEKSSACSAVTSSYSDTAWYAVATSW